MEFFHRYIKKTDKVALLLDFDGTLAPLAPHPSLAEMEPETEDAMKHLSENSKVYLAIISGRSAEDAQGKVKLEKITYAGNHGLEIVFCNKSRYNHDIGEELRLNYGKMVAELETSVSVKVVIWFFYSFNHLCFSMKFILINLILIDIRKVER